MSNVITEANWKFHWRLTESAGIMIYLADFKGRRVLWEGSLPYVTIDHQRESLDVETDSTEAHGPWWVPLGAALTPSAAEPVWKFVKDTGLADVRLGSAS